MNRTQIAAIYDNFPPEQQNMPRSEFIKRMAAATDPTKMMQEADRMAQGRIQQTQIDAAIKKAGGG